MRRKRKNERMRPAGKNAGRTLEKRLVKNPKNCVINEPIVLASGFYSSPILPEDLDPMTLLPASAP